MTRLGVTFLLVAVWVSFATVALPAQRASGHGHGAPGGGRGGPGRGVQSPGIPAQPSINRPSFPASGLNRPSFPIHGPLGIGPAAPSPFAATPHTYSRAWRRSHAYDTPLGYGFGLPVYSETTLSDQRWDSGSDEDRLRTAIVLDATPRTALVFIDSAYVGAVDDLLFTGLTLSPGRHWLALEAPEYERKLIEINVTPDRPLRYRVALTPIRRAAAVLIPPRPPETMYAIPGCYGGNRPPVAASLPPGCDIARVRVIRPQRLN